MKASLNFKLTPGYLFYTVRKELHYLARKMKRGDEMQIYLILALVFALVVAVFAVQNAITVDIQFLFWSLPKVPLSLVILASVVSGAVIVFVVGIVRQIQVTMRIREVYNKNSQLEKALEECKTKLGKETEKPETAAVKAPGNQAAEQNTGASKKECE